MNAAPSISGSAVAAGTPRIVNHAPSDDSGDPRQAGRALGLTTPGDIIQLAPELQSDWATITEHYRRVGLDHTEQVIWDLAPGIAAAYPAHALSVSHFGSAQNRARPDPAWQAVVARTHDKNRFLDLAETLGLTVPRTLRYDGADAADRLDRLPYPCFVKPAVPVPGVSSLRCETVSEVQAALARVPAGVPVQIQQAIDSDLFLNLQYEARDGVAVPVAACERRPEHGTRGVLAYPARHAPWAAVDPVAQWMARNGMRGTFAFEVAVANETDTAPRFLPLACDAGFNDAAYPAVIAARLGLDAWLSVTLPTTYRHLAEVYLDDLAYDPARGHGVVLVDWGSIVTGSLGVLIAGSAQHQHTLLRLLRARLGCLR